jgi:hypothetical protein
MPDVQDLKDTPDIPAQNGADVYWQGGESRAALRILGIFRVAED